MGIRCIKYSDVYSSSRLVVLVVVVVIFERTCSFHADLVSLTTWSNGVPSGISSLRLLQALAVDIHEMPTREVTSVAAKVKRPPILTSGEVDDADPLRWTKLPAASVPT